MAFNFTFWQTTLTSPEKVTVPPSMLNPFSTPKVHLLSLRIVIWVPDPLKLLI